MLPFFNALPSESVKPQKEDTGGGSSESSTANPKATFRQLLFIIFWFGLFTGFMEIAIMGIRRLLGHKIFLVSKFVVWMAPLADIVFFLVVIGFCLLLARSWKGINSIRLVIILGIFFFALTLLFMIRGLHPYAAVVLALGIGIRLSTPVYKRWTSFYKFARNSQWWMAGVLLLTTVGVHGTDFYREWHAWRSLPDARKNSPNILLIVLDTVRSRNLSLYGYHRKTTPHLEEFARKSVVFEQAISTAPWTLPAHISMFTGRLPHEVSGNWESPLDDTYPTLAEVLTRHGYHTAGFVANTRYCSYEHGLNRGFIHYEDFRISWREVLNSSALTRMIAKNNRVRTLLRTDELLSRKEGYRVNDSFLSWLDKQDREPFFVFLNYYDAHTPYLPPAPYDKKFGPGRRRGHISPIQRLWESGGHLSPEDLQEEIDAYDGAIAYIDDQLNKLFKALEKKGILQNTIIIITSDHGEEFGEHGFFTHGKSLYMLEIHVPLIISLPEQSRVSKRIEHPAIISDIPATIVDLLNLKSDNPFPGESLVRFWNSPAPEDSIPYKFLLSEVDFARNLPDNYPISRGDMKSIVHGNLHYIKNGDGKEELYDFRQDPDEMENLINSKTSPFDVTVFRNQLEKTVHRNHSQNTLSKK